MSSSSNSSRTRACSALSSPASLPPGNSHFPAIAPVPPRWQISILSPRHRIPAATRIMPSPSRTLGPSFPFFQDAAQLRHRLAAHRHLQRLAEAYPIGGVVGALHLLDLDPP